ncbi:hypothetical protein [Rhodococcus zopfii]|uniref:hypothetical protein n=1 Tax=Rhodococcus zopfii TaxID=43772 RepID=UPI0011112124|nr:hypothetical protein [Rhodococcus zopfii]
MQSTAALSYLVFLILDGADRIIGHCHRFGSAVGRVRSDADRYTADHGAVTLYITTSTILAAYTDGIRVEYRIEPSDRQIPEDEPSAEEVDAADLDDEQLDVLATIEVGDRLQVVLERYIGVTPAGEPLAPDLSVAFAGPIGCLDGPEIPVDRIPDLIDVLTELHRTWLHAGGADADPPIDFALTDLGRIAVRGGK